MAMTGEHARSSQARSEGTEAGTSRSRPKRYKATNMSFDEMVELVEIMRRKDYDGQYGPYKTPNRRKGKIMEKVARKMQRMFGIARSKEQLRKRWSDLKLREPHQLKKIKKIIKKRKLFFVLRGGDNFNLGMFGQGHFYICILGLVVLLKICLNNCISQNLICLANDC